MAIIDMELRNLISGFGELIGCQGLALDSVGRCSLLIGDTITLDLMFDGEHDALITYVDLGALDHDKSESLYPMFLEANLLWGGTSGATLSISDDTPPHAVLAQAILWPGATPVQLHAMIESFLKAAKQWRDVIQESLQDFGDDSGFARSPLAMDSIRG